MEKGSKAGPIDQQYGPSWTEPSKTNSVWQGMASSDSDVVSSARWSVNPFPPSCRWSAAALADGILAPQATQRVDKLSSGQKQPRLIRCIVIDRPARPWCRTSRRLRYTCGRTVLRIRFVGHCGKVVDTTFDLRSEPALPSDCRVRKFSRGRWSIAMVHTSGLLGKMKRSALLRGGMVGSDAADPSAPLPI